MGIFNMKSMTPSLLEEDKCVDLGEQGKSDGMTSQMVEEISLKTTDAEGKPEDGEKVEGDTEGDTDFHYEVDYSSLEFTSSFEMNDCRLAMIGNVDSGKSTLIGVLVSQNLDDGRGAARRMVLKHRHEQENGRTSAVTIEILGYDEQNEQVIPASRGHHARWQEIVEKSSHSVTLIDLCGHERYLKTTLFGLTGMMPDYCCLVVGANMGVQVMTKEHISLATALDIPMFVCLTKLDIAPENVLKTTRRTLAKLLRENGKMPYPVKDMDAVEAAADSIVSNRITPVFSISSVTGQSIDLLKAFVSKIRRSPSHYMEQDKVYNVLTCIVNLFLRAILPLYGDGCK